MVGLKDAREILKIASDAKISVYLDGGWGVDALLGKETRTHNDIDLFIEDKYYADFITAIKSRGFIEFILRYTTADHTVWKDSHGRIIDLHKFSKTPNGKICYDGEYYPADIFNAEGKIADIRVECIDAYNQVMFHTGYEHDKNDVHDVLMLCKTFDIPIPDEYK